MMNVEQRPVIEPVEVRSEGGRLILTGTAIRYGAKSRDLGGFRERVMPGSATEAVQKGDVMALDEHRSDRYLGRTSNGTLRLVDSNTELRYEVDLPDTAIGREVASLAERRDYKGSSFGFRTRAESVEWTKDDDGVALRTIRALSLLRDVGPTISPAYEATTAEMALRSFAVESGCDVEVRSVLEAAKRGDLAALLDAAVEAEAEEPAATPLPVVRRPLHWFF